MIEVMAATVLLGTVMASMITAKSRFTHQQVASDRRVEAVAVADQLLERWWITGGVASPQLSQEAAEVEAVENELLFSDLLIDELYDSEEVLLPMAMPRNGTGGVPGDDDWLWRTSELSGGGSTELGLSVIRLELFDRRNKEAVEPVLSIDIVAPAPEPMENDEMFEM